jgi:tetraspanin-11
MSICNFFFLQSFGKCTLLPGNIYTSGCLNVTEKFVKDHAAIIGGAGIGVACLMVTMKLKLQNTIFLPV